MVATRSFSIRLILKSKYSPAVELLLQKGANPSLNLGSPIGSALCAAVDTTCEHRRSNEQRLGLLNLPFFKFNDSTKYHQHE